LKDKKKLTLQKKNGHKQNWKKEKKYSKPNSTAATSLRSHSHEDTNKIIENVSNNTLE